MKVENIATFAKVRRLYEAMLEDLHNINEEFEVVMDLESKKVEVVLYNNIVGSFDFYNGELECGNRFWLKFKAIDLISHVLKNLIIILFPYYTGITIIISLQKMKTVLFLNATVFLF